MIKHVLRGTKQQVFEALNGYIRTVSNMMLPYMVVISYHLLEGGHIIDKREELDKLLRLYWEQKRLTEIRAEVEKLVYEDATALEREAYVVLDKEDGEAFERWKHSLFLTHFNHMMAAFSAVWGLEQEGFRVTGNSLFLLEGACADFIKDVEPTKVTTQICECKKPMKPKYGRLETLRVCIGCNTEYSEKFLAAMGYNPNAVG